jgi:hypothetical protein
VTAESSCRGLPSVRPLPRRTFPSTAKRSSTRDVLSHHPLTQQQIKLGRIELGEHSEKGAIAGRHEGLFFLIPSAPQGPQLPLTELGAFLFECLIASSSQEHRHRRASQDKGLRMPQAVPAASISKLFEQIQQRAQRGRTQRTGPTDGLLMLGQLSGQTPAAQQSTSPRTKLPQVKLFGLACL